MYSTYNALIPIGSGTNNATGMKYTHKINSSIFLAIPKIALLLENATFLLNLALIHTIEKSMMFAIPINAIK